MAPEPKVDVLLVDDHPENLLALEAILDSLGQNLVKANSGEEALRRLLNQDFAVILLDVQMPGMDGFETATLIRQRERSRHTPIIFLTAFSTSDTLVFKGYSLGAVDYLLKPIEPEILTSKVAVFVDLFKKTAEVKRQAAQLAAVNFQLSQSEQRFRSLSACSPVGIFLTDIEGNCTYTNPRCQGICGSIIQENFKEGWLQSVHPEDRDRLLTNWSDWTQEEREYSDEFRLLTSEGIIRWVHVRSSPMLSDRGKLIGHVGTVEDITERKQAEEAHTQIIREQAARQEAETANRMKDEFLATLSHELRTPLNSILGWARLLRTRNLDQNTTARALETIERNAKLQAQLIEDILDVSRIIRGKIHLVFRPVNVASLIETALDTVRPAAEAKAIQLEPVIDSSVDLVSGDPDRLQQIVWNLLSNAIKFTPKGGKVEVRLERADAHVQIQVSDTGIGISQDFLPYIFERFRQADSKTTRSYSGLGLGLAIVRELVELHGGIVYAHSAGDGKGATFTVKLPLITDSLKESNANDVPSTVESDLTLDTPLALDNLQILVVDDEPDVRELLTIAFAESGAKVTAVASADEAIKALKQVQPDVLISDIGMPEEDGYTLLRKVRNLDANQGGQIPAVALTAYVREEDCTQALSAGFQMHLSKPVNTTELIRAVAKLARHAQKV
jgi:PAS domain S-box-containing protein